MAFDFERDAPAIHTVAAPFTRSPWQDVGMRDPNLSAFQRRGGKLIVPHGESDPVFPPPTRWPGLTKPTPGPRAARPSLCVFPCPAWPTAAAARPLTSTTPRRRVVRWVEQGQAPDRIEVCAGAPQPWPGCTRLLCPHPLVARYVGQGDPERSESFACKP